MANVRAFLAIEKSLATRLQKSWGAMAAQLQKQVETAVANKDYDKAYRLVNNLDITPLIEENLPYIRYSTYAALFFGASRLTKKAKDTTIKSGEWDSFVDKATKRLRESIQYNVVDGIQTSLLNQIQAAEDAEHAERLTIKKQISHTSEKTPFLQRIANLLGVSTEAKNRKLPVEEAVAKEDDFSGETLYVHRKLLNWQELDTWAKQNGFPTNLAEKMHVTIAYSKAAVNWYSLMPEVHDLTVRGGKREVKPLGDGGAVVLSFESPELEARWDYYKSMGASWDYDGYRPHVTITWDLPEGFDLGSVAPYAGDLIFGQEWWEKLDEDWKSGVVEKAERIAREFTSFSRTGDSLLQMVSALHTSRVSAVGFVAEAETLGVSEYAISEQLDNRICPICFEMHGKRFRVADARATLDTVFAVDSPDDLKSIQPWPKQDKASVSRFKKLDDDQLVLNNWHIPPFHPGCRGLLVHVNDVPVLTQLPSTQAAYEKEPEYLQTAADFAAYGTKATLDDIGAWNTWVGMPVKDYLAAVTGKNPFQILRQVEKTGVTTMSVRTLTGEVPRISIATAMESGVVEMQLLLNESTVLLTAVPETVTRKMLTRWVDLWKELQVSYYMLEAPLTNAMSDALQLIAQEKGINLR